MICLTFRSGTTGGQLCCVKCKTAVIQPHQTVGSIKYLVITYRVPNKATHGYDEGLIDSTEGDKVTVMILENKEVSLIQRLWG